MLPLDPKTDAVSPHLSEHPAYHSLPELARRFPHQRSGRPIHVATLTRWIVGGVRGRDGNRIKLEAKRLPGRWIVSENALSEFVEAVTHDRSGPATLEQPTKPRSGFSTVGPSAGPPKEDERIEQELVAQGFGPTRARRKSSTPRSRAVKN
jgi:hypothetical protein